jgi:hypothetical protein
MRPAPRLGSAPTRRGKWPSRCSLSSNPAWRSSSPCPPSSTTTSLSATTPRNGTRFRPSPTANGGIRGLRSRRRVNHLEFGDPVQWRIHRPPPPLRGARRARGPARATPAHQDAVRKGRVQDAGRLNLGRSRQPTNPGSRRQTPPGYGRGGGGRVSPSPGHRANRPRTLAHLLSTLNTNFIKAHCGIADL